MWLDPLYKSFYILFVQNYIITTFKYMMLCFNSCYKNERKLRVARLSQWRLLLLWILFCIEVCKHVKFNFELMALRTYFFSWFMACNFLPLRENVQSTFFLSFFVVNCSCNFTLFQRAPHHDCYLTYSEAISQVERIAQVSECDWLADSTRREILRTIPQRRNWDRCC